MTKPGPIILLGSGEASPSIRTVYQWLFDQLEGPVKAVILETPAGFEPNSAQVAGQIEAYLHKHLQNFKPQISIVPARKRGTAYSPDDPCLLTPFYEANVILTGPGSPTYAVRQLQDSVAWHTLCARHRMGTAIIFSSAATVASSRHALPVYEIYKVGEDLHWKAGLDFFKPFGLSPIIIPHWNNNDGGSDLDTSRCYIGQKRFAELRQLLPKDQVYLGIDENTALIFEPQSGMCQVMGAGGVTIVTGAESQFFDRGSQFSANKIGKFQMPTPTAGIPTSVWESTLKATEQAQQLHNEQSAPNAEVMRLVERRIQARNNKDWATADLLRDEIEATGWRVKDTPGGAVLEQISES